MNNTFTKNDLNKMIAEAVIGSPIKTAKKVKVCQKGKCDKAECKNGKCNPVSKNTDKNFAIRNKKIHKFDKLRREIDNKPIKGMKLMGDCMDVPSADNIDDNMQEGVVYELTLNEDVDTNDWMGGPNYSHLENNHEQHYFDETTTDRTNVDDVILEIDGMLYGDLKGEEYEKLAEKIEEWYHKINNNDMI